MKEETRMNLNKIKLFAGGGIGCYLLLMFYRDLYTYSI